MQSRSHQSGATIYSVAERAGVSIASVSRVLQGSAKVSDRTREKVLAAVEQLDYLPHGGARSLAASRHEAQGLVLPELTGPYFAELLMGFEARSAELGHSVVLRQLVGNGDPRTALRGLAARVDGIAVLASAALPERLVHDLRAQRPVVVLAGEASDDPHSVRAENGVAAADLTTHLLEHGRTRLLFVGDPDDAPDVADRYRGFRAAHEHRGVEPADAVRVPFREEAGRDVARRWLAGELQADALCCANDEIALSVQRAVQEAGYDVPGDLAVVGFDDVMAARFVRPGLTTVRQPVRRLGEAAAERLHALVVGGELPTAQGVLPTELVVRGSCGCPDPAP